MTDIVSIMVEAAEAERAVYTLDKTGNPVRPYVLLKWGVGGAVGVWEGYEAKCKAHLTGLVVQAQLRALHAAGFRIIHETVQLEYGIPGLLEELDLKPFVHSAALRENG